MENNTQYTVKQASPNILIYIIIGIALLALVWIVTKNMFEPFFGEDTQTENRQNPTPEVRNVPKRILRNIKPNIMNLRQKIESSNKRNSSNSSMDTEDIDERIRKQAIIAHQLHLIETEQNQEKNRQIEMQKRHYAEQSQRADQMTQREDPLPYMMEMEKSSYMPLAASVPPSHSMGNLKPFESQDSTLVQFAKDTQHIVDKYRPNDMYKKIPNNNGSYYELTADDRTIALMNEIEPNQNINDVACNLSNSMSDNDKNMISNYKNKYYNMYAHQINCANGKGNMTGCAKKCYANSMSPSTCDTQSCMDSMDELNNGADFVSLNQLILEKNNSRSCSTCTQQPMLSRAVGVQNILDQVTNLDNVSSNFMNSQILDQDVKPVQSKENFSDMSRELIKKDNELAKKKKVTFANVNNFANFNNYVAQNGVLETSVDKMAEIRSNVTSNATCELNKYGQSISEVYDNLMKNPYMQYQKSCDTSKITGILEDKINNYESNGNFGGNYGGDYAHV
jgi:hypothetical protein